MDQGTGKSLTLLSVAAQRQGKWDRLFWVTPCSLRTNVRGQIAEHTDIPSEAVCVWTDKVLRKGPDPSALVHVVGVETIGSSDRVALAFRDLVTGRNFVAMDESTYIKGHAAKRTQRLISMSCKARYRMILTGTPLTQGCVDLWAQFAFLSPKILGYGSFWAFARRHLVYDEVKVNGRSIRTDRIIGERHMDELAARIAPYVYQVRKDECLELPDKLRETVWTELTRGQEQAYRQWQVMLRCKDIREREGGVMPVVVIDKPLSCRMASTIRHNRARGTHDIDLMVKIVGELVQAGMSDAWILKNLGMDADELLRMKQVSGIVALFKDCEFSRAWTVGEEPKDVRHVA